MSNASDLKHVYLQRLLAERNARMRDQLALVQLSARHRPIQARLFVLAYALILAVLLSLVVALVLV